ncbi:hypothetical protein ScPMuIL_008373 [Solemya velum]
MTDGQDNREALVTDLFKDYGEFDDDTQALVVSKDSLRKVMQGAGCNPTPTDIENILRENKFDNDAKVDMTEFMKMMEGRWMSEADRIKEIQDALSRLFGTDDVSQEQLRNALCNMGDEPFTEEEAGEIFNRMRFDDSEKISCKDLIEFLQCRDEVQLVESVPVTQEELKVAAAEEKIQEIAEMKEIEENENNAKGD